MDKSHQKQEIFPSALDELSPRSTKVIIDSDMDLVKLPKNPIDERETVRYNDTALLYSPF